MAWYGQTESAKHLRYQAVSNSCEALALREVPNTYLARYSFVAFVSCFGIDSTQSFHGVAVMRSISKRIACLCVLLTFWSAIAFAAHQHSNATESATVHGLYRRPFSFPQSYFNSVAKADVRFCIHLSGGAELQPSNA